MSQNCCQTYFQSAWWIRTIAETYGYRPVLVDKCGNNPIYFMLVSSPLTGRRLIGLPFVDYSLFRGDDGDWTDLFEKMHRLKGELGLDYVEIRSLGRLNSLNGHFQRVEIFSTFRVRIGNIDEMYNKLDRRFRQSIRVARESGVKVVMDNSFFGLKSLYRLNLFVRRKHGVPIQPFAFFRNIWKYGILGGNGFILLAKLNGRPIAGIMFLREKEILFAKYNGSIKEFLNRRPNHLIYWEALKLAREMSLEYLDLGRTGIDEINLRRFKKTMGAQEELLSYYIFPPAKASEVYGKFKSSFTNRILKATPLFVNRSVGELFYKHFA
ncbi:MAG TPA: GNAT family N-acetyltransferase [Deltaproteobacteria bacterium]|nr:MAG: hypothetical protein DRQ04_06210 [Candidatus Hydrothermae bacterium]RLB08860.1 MAG: hypothetical protein DRG59_03935 [Deltaproteobacteria bacterium]HDM76984.1 GNAT family N-acetyltransferase [Deltaproteobacteria bacterium]